MCFPHGGGAAGAYRTLAAALAPDIETVAVQYPGRQDRIAEPFVTDITTLADHAVCGLPGSFNRPLAIFGHSMGATVAFEAARMLTERRRPPVALFVSGRPAPDFVETQTLHLDSDAAILDEMRRLGGPESETIDMLVENPALAEMVLPYVRADYQAVETYRLQPGAELTCPIVALLSTEDPTTTEEQMRAWAAHTSGPFQLHTFGGGHFYLESHLPKIAGVIKDQLESSVP
ncbi:thioesterase [Skermania sp. ID1734]|nr:thioesterase [Skermania sp. ID1734]